MGVEKRDNVRAEPGSRIAGRGDWRDLGSKRRTQRRFRSDCEDSDGSTDREEEGQKGKPFWWFILMVHFLVLVNCLSHTCAQCSSPLLPPPFPSPEPSSVVDTFGCLLQSSWRKPSGGPYLSLNLWCVVHATGYFLSPVSPACAHIHSIPGIHGMNPDGSKWHNHNSGSCLYECFCWQST